MISLLRGLMSGDGNINRPFLSLLLLGIFDFCCILIGLESFNDGKVFSGIVWIVVGVVSGLIGYYWSQIRPLYRRVLYSLVFSALLAGLGIGIYHYYHKGMPHTVLEPAPQPTTPEVIAQSDIKIGDVQIGTVDSRERLVVQETARIKPGEPWGANVHYINQGTRSHDVAYYYVGAFFDGMKTHDREKINEMEDQEWNKFLVETQIPTTTIQVSPQRPMFSSFKATSLSAKQLHNLATY